MESEGAPGWVRVFFDRLLTGLNAIGSAWVLGIMVLVNIDVVARSVFNRPMSGVPLVITMSLVSIVFLQLADALKAGRVTRNEAFIGRLLVRRPGIGFALQAFFHAAGAVFMTLLFAYTVPFFEKAWRLESYLGNRGDFTLPDWPFKLLILVGAGAAGLQFLVLVLADLRRVSRALGGGDS